MTIDTTLEHPAIDAGSGPTREEVDEAPFRFVHRHGFAELLESLGASLVVTTYQAGKLVTSRARDGNPQPEAPALSELSTLQGQPATTHEIATRNTKSHERKQPDAA